MNQEKYDKKFEIISKELAKIFHTKNIGYGGAYFKNENKSQWFFELKRKYIRLDQISKLELLNNGRYNKNEKRENLKDLANYCIMEIIRMK